MSDLTFQNIFHLDLHPDTWYRMRVIAQNYAGKTECVLNFATPPLELGGGSLKHVEHRGWVTRMTKLKIQRQTPLYDRLEFMLPLTAAIMLTIVVMTIIILRRKRKLQEKQSQSNHNSLLRVPKHEIETIHFRSFGTERPFSTTLRNEAEFNYESQVGDVIYKKFRNSGYKVTKGTVRNQDLRKKRIFPSSKILQHSTITSSACEVEMLPNE